MRGIPLNLDRASMGAADFPPRLGLLFWTLRQRRRPQKESLKAFIQITKGSGHRQIAKFGHQKRLPLFIEPNDREISGRIERCFPKTKRKLGCDPFLIHRTQYLDLVIQ